MTPEDEEFNRIEQESRIKQEYVRSMWHKRQDPMQPIAYGIRDKYGNIYDCHTEKYGDYDVPLYTNMQEHRNAVIEEVAKEIEKFNFAFGIDTVASFAVYIRNMKS